MMKSKQLHPKRVLLVLFALIGLFALSSADAQAQDPLVAKVRATQSFQSYLEVATTVDDVTDDAMTVTYWLVNDGPQDIISNGIDESPSVRILNLLPAGTRILSSEQSAGWFDADAGSWNMAGFAADEVATLKLRIQTNGPPETMAQSISATNLTAGGNEGVKMVPLARPSRSMTGLRSSVNEMDPSLSISTSGQPQLSMNWGGRGGCTPVTINSLVNAGSTVNGGTATLVVPFGACPITVSYSSYALPSGDKLPFEDQLLFDNITDTYGPGTYHLNLDLPDCAYQTDLYLGPVLAPLEAQAHGGILIGYSLDEGEVCSGIDECIHISFEEDAAGNTLHRGQVIDNEYAASGVTIASKDGEKLMIFDTQNPTGGDWDLGTPGSFNPAPTGYGPGNTHPLGNVLILSEDGDENDPDDDAGGGTMIFTFDEDVRIQEVNLLDIDLDESATAYAFAYDINGNPIATANAQNLGDNSFQSIKLNVSGVRRLEVVFSSSGALSGLVFCKEVNPILGSLGDRVWFDTDANGLQDDGATGVNDVTVNLIDADTNTQINTQQTAGDGNYLFTDLPAGNYVVEFILPNGQVFTTKDVGGNGNDADDSDADETTGRTDTIALAEGEDNLTIDAGLVDVPVLLGSLGDRVWFDTDANGLQDDGATGVNDVTVNLIDADMNTQINTQQTAGDGNYLFTDLPAGNYVVEFILPTGQVFTTKDVGGNGNDADDSDADETTGRTDTIALAEGEDNLTIDAGLVDVCTVDAGPPTVAYDATFDPGTVTGKVIVTVTDDTGILSITHSSLSYGLHGEGYLTEVLTLESSDFVVGNKTATLVFSIPDLSLGYYLFVQAEDLCGKTPACDVPFDPATGTGQVPPLASWGGLSGGQQTGYIYAYEGGGNVPMSPPLKYVNFFRLTNASVVLNPTDVEGERRVDFTLTKLANPYVWGFIAADECYATITDPLEVETGVEMAFQEEKGQVVMEAEHFTGREAGTDNAADHSWETIDYGSGGSSLKAMPNTGMNTGEKLNGARLDYAVNFTKAGTYYVWVRMYADDGDDNSVHAGLNGQGATFGKMGLTTNRYDRWEWTREVEDRRGSDWVTIQVPSAGVHTVNLWMREDGTIVDKIVLTNNRYYYPRWYGPNESPLVEVTRTYAKQSALGEKGGGLQLGLQTDVETAEEAELPREFALEQNYPNPFNPTTTIEFALPEASNVHLVVYNLLGQEVQVLANGDYKAGRHEVHFDATNLPSGVYLYRLTTSKQAFLKRMVLVK